MPDTQPYDENLILAYVEDELSPADRRRFEQQLASDARLSELVELLRADRAELRDMAEQPAPPQVMDHVQQLLERSMLLDARIASHTPNREGEDRLLLTRFFAYAAVAAAVTFSALGLWVYVFDGMIPTPPHHQPPPSIAMNTDIDADAERQRELDAAKDLEDSLAGERDGRDGRTDARNAEERLAREGTSQRVRERDGVYDDLRGLARREGGGGGGGAMGHPQAGAPAGEAMSLTDAQQAPAIQMVDARSFGPVVNATAWHVDELALVVDAQADQIDRINSELLTWAIRNSIEVHVPDAQALARSGNFSDHRDDGRYVLLASLEAAPHQAAPPTTRDRDATTAKSAPTHAASGTTRATYDREQDRVGDHASNQREGATFEADAAPQHPSQVQTRVAGGRLIDGPDSRTIDLIVPADQVDQVLARLGQVQRVSLALREPIQDRGRGDQTFNFRAYENARIGSDGHATFDQPVAGEGEASSARGQESQLHPRDSADASEPEAHAEVARAARAIDVPATGTLADGGQKPETEMRSPPSSATEDAATPRQRADDRAPTRPHLPAASTDEPPAIATEDLAEGDAQAADPARVDEARPAATADAEPAQTAGTDRVARAPAARAPREPSTHRPTRSTPRMGLDIDNDKPAATRPEPFDEDRALQLLRDMLEGQRERTQRRTSAPASPPTAPPAPAPDPAGPAALLPDERQEDPPASAFKGTLSEPTSDERLETHTKQPASDIIAALLTEPLHQLSSTLDDLQEQQHRKRPIRLRIVVQTPAALPENAAQPHATTTTPGNDAADADADAADHRAKPTDPNTP